MKHHLLLLVLFSTLLSTSVAFDTLMTAMEILQEAFSEKNRIVWFKLQEHLKRKKLHPSVLVDMDSDALDDLFRPILAEVEVYTFVIELFYPILPI